jgi:Cu2+-exporting ATPase
MSTTLLDDPQAWQQFSHPFDERAPASRQGAAWSSQVMLEGMHCAACALNIESALLAVPGVQDVTVNAATHRAQVVWRPDQVQPSRWFQAVEAAGYRAVPAQDNGRRTARLAEQRRVLWRWLVACCCMMQVMMYATPAYVTGAGEMSPDMAQLLRWASWVLTLPVVLFSCQPFWANAWRDLRLRRVSMDLPVALGMAITFVVSTAATFEPDGPWGGEVYFDSLTMFVFFLLSSRWLEGRLRERTAGALEALMNRLPDSVERLEASGQWERVAVHRLRPGDRVRVLPGESFPADGTLLVGQTLAQEALLTGESRPLARGPGESVLAGSLNVSATVEMQIVAVGDSTRYAQIVALMDHASLVKPRLALLADRMARPFLLGVLLAAGAAGAWWWSQSPAQALMVAVSVLIVTCPCALSLATPAAMLAAAGHLARHGILVRELQSLEALTQIDTVVFDKTGTLTRDGQRLDRQWTAPGVDARQALHCAASLASHSWHPLSRALVQAWQDEAQTLPGAEPDMPAWTSVIEVPGKGLEATWGGEADVPPSVGAMPDSHAGVSAQRFRLGSWSFGQEGLAAGQVPADAEQAQVHLFAGSRWMASFSLSEDLRDDVLVTLQGLSQMGLSVRILSGDRPAAVAALAARVGLPPDAAWGGCSPADKLRHLESWQQAGHRVLMVGDGLNDGPVMAAAQVSMAVGAAVPLTQARADFVLMGEALQPVVQTLTLSRRTLRVVRQNLAWAACYNALCVPLAMAGWLPAWLAGLGMAFSSIGVVLHSLRLGRPLAREHIPLSVPPSGRFKPQIV